MGNAKKTKATRKKTILGINILWPAAIIFFIAACFAMWNLAHVSMSSYPANDLCEHIALIKFAREYGFFGSVPYWNNGDFYVGKINGITYYSIGVLISYLFSDYRVAFILSYALMFILGLIASFIYGKVKKYSLKKSLLFYILFFCSPLAIAYFIGLGSPGSFIGWIMILLMIAIFEHYKDRPIDWGFATIIPVYALAIMSHIYIFILSSIILLWFFICRTKRIKEIFSKDNLIIIFCGMASLVITSFWWIYFFSLYNRIIAGNSIPYPYQDLKYIFALEPYGAMFTFIIPIMFLLLIWYQREKVKQNYLYYIVPLVISVLMITRTLSFVPVLNRIGPENMCLLIYLYTLILLFDANITMPKNLARFTKFVAIAIIISTMLVGAMFAYTYYYSNSLKLTPLDNEAISLVSNHSTDIHNMIIVYDWSKLKLPIYIKLNAYFSFKYDINTSQTALGQSVNSTLAERLNTLENLTDYSQCNKTEQSIRYLGPDHVLTLNIDCSKVRCGYLELVDKSENVCLFRVINATD